MKSTISYGNYELSWKLLVKTKKHPEGRIMTHRLGAGEGYPRNPISELLFQQFGLVFLICSKLPHIISTDFPVLVPVRDLICGMYERCKLPRPVIKMSCTNDLKPVSPYTSSLDPAKAVLGNSGGKDSAYTLLRLAGEMGKENILSVHIRNLNTEGVSHREWPAAARLADYSKVEHCKIELTNSSKIPGPVVMNARDILLLGILAAKAVERGAGSVFIEGPSESDSAEARFSSLPSTYKAIKAMLGALGMEINFRWYDGSAYDILRRLYESKDWARVMPLSHSCLAENRRMSWCRKSHGRHTPALRELLYDGQCGGHASNAGS
jgi:hypothetical protein